MYQEPTNISTYFYDTSSIAISFTVSDTSLLNTKQKYYYMASATDISSNITYATGDTSPIYITKLIPGITYTCNLYLVQTASSDSIIVNTPSFPSFESASIIELSMNSIKLKWIGSDISYVSVKKSVLGQSYIDLSSSVYSSTFTYSDSDISGNTLYSYSITPYMTKTGSLIKGNDTILSNTTPVAYPTDLSAIFYDTSAIKISFTPPKNNYSTSITYTLRVINGSNIINSTASSTSPILIQNLSEGTSYNCYIITTVDSSYTGISNGLNVITNGGIKQAMPIPLTSSTNSTEPANYGGGIESFQMLSFTISNSSYSYANGTYYYSRTSGRDTNAAIIMVDNTTGFWRTNYSTQQYSNGVYIGTNSTVIQTTGTIRGEYAQYQLPYLLKLTSFSVRYREGTAGVAKLIYLCGSTDGVTWYLLSSQTVQTDTVNSLRTYSVSTSNSYNCFRLIMNSNYADSVVDTYSWFLNGIVMENTSLFELLLSTKVPYVRYSAANYSGTTLTDITGNGRNATISGGYTTGYASGNGSTASIPYIGGTTATKILFPVWWTDASVNSQYNRPNYTFCCITRYNSSSNRYNIVGNSNGNIIFGHANGNRGMIYLQNWTLSTNIPPVTDWLSLTLTAANISNVSIYNILLNNVSKTTDNNSIIYTVGNMGINQSSPSNFEFSHLIYWNYTLSSVELNIVSNAFMKYLNTGNMI